MHVPSSILFGWWWLAGYSVRLCQIQLHWTQITKGQHTVVLGIVIAADGDIVVNDTVAEMTSTNTSQ